MEEATVQTLIVADQRVAEIQVVIVIGLAAGQVKIKAIAKVAVKKDHPEIPVEVKVDNPDQEEVISI